MESTKPVARRFEETVRDFWASRPERPLRGRKFAGVAAAIGNRYAIDPTLVRVVLVTSTLFGGSGLLVYLLGWLFLRKQGDQSSAFGAMLGRGTSSISGLFTALLCLALLPASGATLGGDFLFGAPLGGVIGLAAQLVGLYLLHSARGELAITPEPLGEPVAAGASTSGATTTSEYTDWDPLAAAPSAWDLPEPEQPAPEPPPPPRPNRKRPRKVGLFGFGLALLAAIICVAISASGGPWISPGQTAAVALGVVGLTMIIASFRGGGRGLIWLAVLLGAGSLLANNEHASAGGTRGFEPKTVAEVLPNYTNQFGELRLDLRDLPDSGTVHTKVHTRFGQATVILPEHANVRLHCRTNFGSADCLGKTVEGVGAEPIEQRDDGSDGPGGAVIDLDASTNFGRLEVRRG